jgi:hypothetical protein
MSAGQEHDFALKSFYDLGDLFNPGFWGVQMLFHYFAVYEDVGTILNISTEYAFDHHLLTD